MKGSTALKKRRCTALRADGEPCRAWAVRGPADGQSDRPTLCVAHRGAASRALAPQVVASHTVAPIVVDAPRQASLYDDYFSDEEYAALAALAKEDSLGSEIRLVRVVLRRLLADIGPEFGLRGIDLEKRAVVLYKGTELVGRLLQQQRALGDGDGGFQAVMEQALTELGEEWGIEL